MHLQPEGGSYKLQLDEVDRIPIAESCREAIFRISAASSDNEGYWSHPDDPALESLARIAEGAVRGDGLILSGDDFGHLVTALALFGEGSAAKAAIDRFVMSQGTTLEGRFIERRVRLGLMAKYILNELGGSLDGDEIAARQFAVRVRNAKQMGIRAEM